MADYSEYHQHNAAHQAPTRYAAGKSVRKEYNRTGGLLLFTVVLMALMMLLFAGRSSCAGNSPQYTPPELPEFGDPIDITLPELPEELKDYLDQHLTSASDSFPD